MKASTLSIAALTLLGLLSTGCANIAPGKTEAIQPVATTEDTRVGHAYLFRGFIGIFSTGMNTLGDELKEQGVDATVFQADQWASVADTIAERYHNAPNAEPIVLVGHSYGADNILRIAQRLKDKDVKIDLIITLDPVTPPQVPPNVTQVVNLYQSNGVMDALPWLRGIPLEMEKPDSVKLTNANIRTDRTDLLVDGLNHFNIEKQPKVHDEVIKQIEEVCVTRATWAALKAPQQPMVSIHATAMGPTTQPVQVSNAN